MVVLSLGSVDNDFHNNINDVNENSDLRNDTTFLERLGARTEYVFKCAFTKWGKLLATYPWVTLLNGVIIVAILGYGIKYIEITTDPVQLWASPKSKSRIERDFFDTQFEPFFRIEQIIIKAVNLPYIIHNTSNGPITFGPVFHKNFLSEVLYLQEQIKNIQRNKVSLKDICYAPLANDETDIQTSNCVIQSIWGYFKDDLSRLDDHDEDNGFNVTYLDEIYQCTSNPYLCLASYGGPVDPAIALGAPANLAKVAHFNPPYGDPGTALEQSEIR
ncbi:NPC intracellular cholesterol transporter 1 homolog 1b [Drosophila willistoni]|uniref:NPC intracellular cholesterol transporter 1 homolog 1b n=1 Tax=Drosophila willistoni TaxID=7260 RepID=UPI001F081C08|nr:NPC intracellular cholesterol transporter 1 homolog 1b [Drosophila willistoni]